MKFDDIINQDRPVLVDFHAVWCGPCHTQAPILDELKKKLGEKISIIKIDVDKNPNVSQRFQVRSIPTLILFKSSEVVWRKSGIATAHELEQIIIPNF